MTILNFVFAILVVLERSLMDVHPNISSNVAYMSKHIFTSLIMTKLVHA